MINKVFISGMMRSGTTLLQKAIDAHPEVIVDYQTKTSDFIEIKRKFLESISCEEYHVLKHYNPTRTYTYTEFISWIKTALVKQSIGLTELFDNHTGNEEKLYGVKEVLMEEFYIPLMNNGVKCLNIIRDPRDVISSMSFGKGEKHTGAPRPILFDLRNWRKSAHFSYLLEENDNFKSILFEDLLCNPENVLNEVYDWLGLSKISLSSIQANIKSKGWLSNSSFGSRKLFDSKAEGGYKINLPKTVCSYIEAICWPEMKNLGYKTSIDCEQKQRLINDFIEPFKIERSEFENNYSSSLDNIEYEMSRLNKEYDTIVKETFND